jgi:hypothetical protein
MYECEEHNIKTKDGYILTVWRIKGKSGEEFVEGSKPPVLFQPCLDCDMMVYVCNDPDKAPAFQLSNAGYDIWLGNNRGNKYGQRHESLSVDDKEFW